MDGLGEEINRMLYFSHFGELSQAQLISLCRVYRLNQSSFRVFTFPLNF